MMISCIILMYAVYGMAGMGAVWLPWLHPADSDMHRL